MNDRFEMGRDVRHGSDEEEEICDCPAGRIVAGDQSPAREGHDLLEA